MACHSYVPPDALEPLVVRIANEFVSEASAAEVAAAGINAIREICIRQPLAMNETLLQDLVAYKKSKDKGVMMAAKGLLSLYRESNPELLRKKDRGKDATIGLKSGELQHQRFGEEQAGGIEGLELLAKWKEDEKQRKLAEAPEKGSDRGETETDAVEQDDDDFNSSDWDVASDDSSDSGGWIDVSEAEDDAPPSKRQKTESEAPELVEAENPKVVAERAAKLATTSILTPADLAKLQELRMEAELDKAMGQRTNKGKLALQRAAAAARHADDGLTAEQIELPASLRKFTKEERIAHAKEGKPDREEHKSTQAIRRSKKEAAGKSSTNKEKARKKNLMMVMGKAKAKQKRSLVQTRKVLQGHVQRSKRGGRRGNGR
jgi:protein SDA1